MFSFRVFNLFHWNDWVVPGRRLLFEQLLTILKQIHEVVKGHIVKSDNTHTKTNNSLQFRHHYYSKNKSFCFFNSSSSFISFIWYWKHIFLLFRNFFHFKKHFFCNQLAILTTCSFYSNRDLPSPQSVIPHPQTEKPILWAVVLFFHY